MADESAIYRWDWTDQQRHCSQAVEREGLQTMRTLAQNMAYLLKAEEAAEKAGIARPEYEDVTLTNFIR